MNDVDADVIVIGAGHNGLIAAGYLAQAGLDVLVLEARSAVGGCSSTESFGGCRVNICNCDHITFRTTPVMEELELAELGLRYVDIEPSQINISWEGGPAWAVCQSVEQTLEILARTYPTQVDGYREYCRDAIPVAQLVLDAAAAGPRRSDLLRSTASLKGRGLTRLLKWSRLSAVEIMRRYFSEEALVTPALATGPVVWGLSPDLPGTGLGALTYALRHVATVGRPIGGSGRLAEVLAHRVRLSGGRIETDSPVSSILLEGNRTRGVSLETGEVKRSHLIVSAVDPGRTFLEWVKNPPPGIRRTVDRWRNQPHQAGYESKIDAIVTRLPRYRNIDYSLFGDLGLSPDGVSTMITPTASEMHEGFLSMSRGLVMNRPVFFANVPSVHDPSMSSRIGEHVFSLEALFTPYGIPGGWPNSVEPSRWLQLHDSLLLDSISNDMRDWRAMTPDIYESEFYLPRGHATSFAGGPLAAFRGKPSELTRYRTGLEGLYLCGAATFPGAGIWGASGRHCAREILGSL